MGWCAVEPRCNYEHLLRYNKVPWSGREQDKQDCTVWAITCLFARAGFRRQGISRTLVHAAVRFARDRGARAIEAYPMTTSHALAEELHCGLLTTFLDAGFTQVTRPTKRRAVVRVELASREGGSTRARKDTTMSYTIRPLDASTWDAFAELVERNNGIFGGCWCIGYHPECGQKGISHRAVKEDRVRTGRAHAALVLDEAGAAQGWCQYGSPEELPGIKHKREYEKDAPPRPHWRITCVYVDKKHRSQGIARAALEGALDQIAHAGGGLVEAISEVTTGREAQGRFLFSATLELFEQCGFTRGRQVGKHAWILSRVVDLV